MADAGVTTTGLVEMRRAVEAFPEAVTAALRAVARRTAERELATARERLRAQQKTPAHALADAIEIADDSANHQFLVVSRAPSGQPTNLPIWNEHGTRYMVARPYMRPANDLEQDRYRREMESASTAAAEQTFRE